MAGDRDLVQRTIMLPGCGHWTQTAGIEAMEQMLCEDAQRLTGARHGRDPERCGHRGGTTEGKIGFHGGKVLVQRIWQEGLLWQGSLAYCLPPSSRG
jgi:hypothetical protein